MMVFFVTSFICFAQDDDTQYTPNKMFPEEIVKKIYDYYMEHLPKIPDEATLKNMKIDKNISSDVTKVLEKYDLMRVCTYQFHPAGGDYELTENWHRYERYHTKKGALEFIFGNFKKENVIQFYYSRNYFTDPKKIEKQGQYYYFSGYSTVEKTYNYNPVVYFKDNLLIVDMTYSGKLGDINNSRRFRAVYLLVPRFF